MPFKDILGDGATSRALEKKNKSSHVTVSSKHGSRTTVGDSACRRKSPDFGAADSGNHKAETGIMICLRGLCGWILVAFESAYTISCAGMQNVQDPFPAIFGSTVGLDHAALLVIPSLMPV